MPGRQSPTAPSTHSRRRSACPLWRAYSSIMCTSTQRCDTDARVRPVGQSRSTSRSSAAATTRLCAHSSANVAKSSATDRVVDEVEVAVGILVAPVAVGRVLASEHVAEPVTLDVGHVAHEAEQRHRRRRHRAPPELLVGEAVALHEQRGAVVLEPLVEHRPLGDQQAGIDASGRHAAVCPRAPVPHLWGRWGTGGGWERSVRTCWGTSSPSPRRARRPCPPCGRPPHGSASARRAFRPSVRRSPR